MIPPLNITGWVAKWHRTLLELRNGRSPGFDPQSSLPSLFLHYELPTYVKMRRLRKRLGAQ